MTDGVEHNFVGLPCYQAGPDEEYMNLRQVQHFMKMLKKWREMLIQGADKAVDYLHENQHCPDVLDRAANEDEQFFQLRTKDRERKLIAKIEATVERILKNDYGYCDACGREIGIGRLEARPTATLCIDCKTYSETKESREVF